MLLLLLLFSLVLINIHHFSDFGYSLLMCSNFIVVLLLMWNVTDKKLTPALLFFATFIFLFMGGRFWGVLLGSDDTLWRGTFFYNDYLNIHRRIGLLSYLLIFIYFFALGYKMSYSYKLLNKTYRLPNNTVTIMNRILNVFFYIVAPLNLYSIIQTFLSVLSSGSYLSLFIRQAGSYSSIDSLAKTLLDIAFGFAMVFGTRQLKRNYLILFFFMAFVGLLMGGRGKFGCILLFILWLYSQNHKINIKKLVLLTSSALTLLLVIFQFSIRNMNASVESSVLDLFASFFFSQGSSLFVFEISQNFQYPFIPYIQSFIPGTSFIYSLISGETLSNSDVLFSHSLASQLNPQLYHNGNGLGWTLMGDLYLFSGRNIYLFGVLTIIFGYVLGYIERKSLTNPIYMVIIYTIFLKLMFLPRASLSSVVPLIIYVLVFVLVFMFVAQISKLNSKHKVLL